MANGTNIVLGAIVGDFVAAMGAAGQAVARLTTQLNTNLVAGYSAADRAQRTFDRGIGRAADSMVSFGQKASILTAGLGLLATQGFTAYASIDALQRGLAVTAGSAAAGAAEMKQLQAVAKLPGLGLEEAVQGSVRLQAVGFSAEKARRVLLEFGNAIALTGGGKAELNTITTQLGQLAAKGKVLSQDLKPIIEAAPSVAKTIKQLFGTIDPEEISAKLKAAGKNSTDFVDLLTTELAKLERVSGGPKNAIENLGDSLKLASFVFFGAADKSLGLTQKLDGLGSTIAKLATGFSDLSPLAQGVIFSLVGIAAGIGPVVLGLGTLVKFGPQLISTFTTGFGAMRTGLAALISPIGLVVVASAAVAGLAYSFYQFNQAVESTFDKTKALTGLRGQVTETIGAEKNQLEALLKVVRNENLSIEDRRAAIARINAISPEFLGSITAETINTDGATAAIKRYTTQLTLKAKAQALAARLADGEARLLEEEGKKLDTYIGIADKAAASFSHIFQENVDSALTDKAFARKAQALTDLRKQNELYRTELDRTTGAQARFDAQNGSAAPATPFNAGGGAPTLKEQLKAVNKEIDAAAAKGGINAVPPALLARAKDLRTEIKRIQDATKAPGKPKAERAEKQPATELQFVADLIKRVGNEAQKLGQIPISLRTDAEKNRMAGLLAQLQALKTKQEEIKAITADPKTELASPAPIQSTATNKRVAGIVDTVEFFDAFKKNVVDDFKKPVYTALQALTPGFAFMQERIQTIRETLTDMSLKGLSIPPEAISGLTLYATKLREVSDNDARIDLTIDNAQGGTGPKVEVVDGLLAKLKEGKTKTKLGFEDLSKAISAQSTYFADAASTALQGIGGAIGKGENPLKAGLSIILNLLADYAIKIGAAALISSDALLLAAPFLAGATLPQGIGLKLAGGALVLAGATIKGLAATAFASGGLVSGPTLGLVGEYPGASTNKEFIAPVSTAKGFIREAVAEAGGGGGGLSRLRGEDVYVAQQRTQKRRARVS